MPIAYTNTTITAKPATSLPGGSPSSIPTPARPRIDSSPPSHLNDDFLRPPTSSGPFPWSLGAAVLGVALMVTVGVSWSKVSSRNSLIQEGKVRAEQAAAETTVIQAQLAESKALTTQLQSQLDETKAENVRLNLAVAQDKVVITGLQAELAKALQVSSNLKQENEQAKAMAPAPLTAVQIAQAAEIQRRRSIQNPASNSTAIRVAEHPAPTGNPE